MGLLQHGLINKNWSQGRRWLGACAVLLFALNVSGCMDSVSQSPPPPPSSGSFPGALAAQNLNGTTITLTWPQASSPFTYYQIYNVQSNGTLQATATVPLNQTTWTQSGLTPGTLYRYVVQAVDGNGNSDGNQQIVSALAYAGGESDGVRDYPE